MTADREPEKIVKLAHPFRVAARQVIVHRHEMRAASGQRVEIKRQRRDQSLAFAGRHFRDPAAMQNDAADQLHIEVHHVPGHRLIADRESVLPFGQTARRIFHDRECFRQNLIEPCSIAPRTSVIARELVLPGRRFRAQIIVRERFELLVEFVDLRARSAAAA